MPADRVDLAARIAASTRDDTVRGLVFNAAFDVVREHAGEEAAAAVDPLGRGKRSDFISYPVADLLTVVWNVADRVERPLGGVARAFHEMGYRATANVLGSMVGHTVLVFGRSPRALLAQAPSVYRTTVSYGQRSVEWLGERHALLRFQRDFLAGEYHRGVLQAALDATGARETSILVRPTGFLDNDYEVRWS